MEKSEEGQEEKGGEKGLMNPFGLPERGLNFKTNELSRYGNFVDQDKKGNTWSVEIEPLKKETQYPIPLWILLPACFILPTVAWLGLAFTSPGNSIDTNSTPLP